MATQATTVIDIVAQVTDETAQGTQSAQKNVSKLEQSMQNLAKRIAGMKGQSKLEVKATLKDMASKGLQSVAAAGKKIAGKVWTVTLKAVDLVSAPFKKIWGLITNPITQMAAFAGVAFGVADTINTFKDFEQGMANVKAISGATGEEFDALTAKAKELGETTMFSTSEAAAAMENLAMAGWKSNDIISGMSGLLDLAAAGSVDIATAADVTSSALAQFNLNADQATRVADVLAATATNSKTDVQGLGESLKYAGPLAGSLGYSIEDVAVALGVMGNSAIDASSAGTALRGVLARMSKQEGLTAEESNAVAEAMRKVGVSMTDEKGKSKSLLAVMTDLRKGFARMTDSEKAATAANLAGQNAMSGLLAIVNASDEDFDKLTKSINNAEGAAAKMAATKMDTLQGSLYYLQSAAEGVKIAIGEKLQPYVKGLVDWITQHMPEVQAAVGEAVDWMTRKIDGIIASIHSLTSSPEWAKAETLWDKIKLAWDKLIAEPFDAWWNSTGKAWLAEKANGIGKGIGTALHDGLLMILGVDTGDALQDGTDIGKSFADGFLQGFNGKEVAEALAQAIKDALKFLFTDAATLLPGGKEASSSAPISAGLLAYGGFKLGSAGYKTYKAGKAIWNGVKGIGSAIGSATGISEGIQIAKAAKSGGAAAQSAMTFAESGALGGGVKIGATAAKAGGKVASAGSKAIPIIGGILSLAEMGFDAFTGTQKAGEWNDDDSVGSKVAAGVGAFFGGTGGGVLGDESVGTKVMDVGGGALKGAGIGAAIGSIIPGAGTAAGAGIGAAIGAVLSAIGGENISKGLKAAGDAIGKFFTKTLPDAFGTLWNGISGFFTETVPSALSTVGSAISNFFTVTIPQFFSDLWDGIYGFFTETVPYALGYAVGKVQIFFTETVPQFFGELWDGITTFFTETVPNAIAMVGEALGTFFTETVPTFFGNLWDGIVGFFTETIPSALETVGEALYTFFAETVPEFFGNLWEGVTTFFTETIPTALETVGEALSTFFTETVPEFFQNLWDGIVKFFTEAIPNAIATVGESIGNFFSNIVDKISGFFENAWGTVKSWFGAGYSDATAHAEGGIMTKPHMGLVAEDGAEAIIPLTSKRRSRGIALWEKAGEILGVSHEEQKPQKEKRQETTTVTEWTKVGKQLGVRAYADGGIVGTQDINVPDTATAATPAEGGIMTKPHMGLVAEDGAEAIIPLTSKRRSRGIALLEKAGKLLGNYPHKEGGIFGVAEKSKPQEDDEPRIDKPKPEGNGDGDNTDPEPKPIPVFDFDGGGGMGGSGAGTSNTSVSTQNSPTVTVENITFEVNIDGSGQDPQTLADAIRENVRGMTDEIAYQLATALQQAYANTPRTAWEG